MGTQHKLKVNKMFGRRLEHLLNAVYTFKSYMAGVVLDYFIKKKNDWPDIFWTFSMKSENY